MKLVLQILRENLSKVSSLALFAGVLTSGNDTTINHNNNSGIIKLDVVKGDANTSYLPYMVEIEIGSNREKSSLVLLNSAGDIMVQSSNEECYNPPGDLCDYSVFIPGHFDESNSTSFHANDTFSESILSGMDGPTRWGHDSVVVGGVEVKDMSFGLTKDMDYGVFGIGLMYGELTKIFDNQIYENLPLKMKSLGLINRAAYSVFLNSTNATTGVVLFGGVDHAKYEGQLTTMPMVFDEYTVEGIVLRDFYIAENGSRKYNMTNSTTYQATLDIDSRFSSFPMGLVDHFVDVLDGSYDKSINAYQVPCIGHSDISLVFDFSGKVIEVPYSEFITTHRGRCVIAEERYATKFKLGVNFMRSVYAVFDMEDKTISLAQAKYSNDDEDLEAISNTIPSATRAPHYLETSFREPDRFSYTTTPTGDYDMSTETGITLHTDTSTDTSTGDVLPSQPVGASSSSTKGEAVAIYGTSSICLLASLLVYLAIL